MVQWFDSLRLSFSADLATTRLCGFEQTSALFGAQSPDLSSEWDEVLFRSPFQGGYHGLNISDDSRDVKYSVGSVVDNIAMTIMVPGPY